MTFGAGAFGEYAFGEEGSPPTVQPSATIEQQIEAAYVRPRAWIEQQIVDTIEPAVTIEQQVGPPTVAPAVTIEQQVGELVAPVAVIEQQIFDRANRAPAWRPLVTLSGVDVSALITGEIAITTEENASPIASFTLVPPAGPVDLLAWVGELVTIDYVEVIAGADALRTRRFTGIVTRPVYVPDSGTVVFNCSGDLQRRVGELDRGTIDLLVGGYWSEHIFDADSDAWRYCTDRLSTRPAALWADGAGVLRVTDWAAKGVPDFTFTDADRIADTISVERADRASLINVIGLTLDFRYSRHLQRNINYRFEWPGSLCEYLKNTFKLPQRSQVEAAASGAGWRLLGGIQYTPVWPGQVVDCTEPTAPAGTRDYRVWALDWFGGETPGLDSFCIGASFTLAKRFARTVTETYSLKIVAEKSREGNGELAVGESYGIESPADDVTWEQDIGFTRLADGLTGNSMVGGLVATMPAGAVELENGDWLFEATDGEAAGRGSMESAQECALNKAKTEILGGHRANRVRFSCVLDPDITLEHTVRIDTARVTATGKIAAVVDRMNVDTGSAVSELALAISQAGAVGVVAETPLAPRQAVVDYPLTEYDRVQWLSYHIGGSVTSPAVNTDWVGYFSNYEFDNDNENPFDAVLPDIEVYPEQFKISTPDISEGDRKSETAQDTAVFYVDIPNDELIEGD